MTVNCLLRSGGTSATPTSTAATAAAAHGPTLTAAEADSDAKSPVSRTAALTQKRARLKGARKQAQEDPIQLLEYPIPPALLLPSQKNAHGHISGTKRGIIDPLVSKRPRKKSEKILKKIKNVFKIT